MWQLQRLIRKAFISITRARERFHLNFQWVLVINCAAILSHRSLEKWKDDAGEAVLKCCACNLTRRTITVILKKLGMSWEITKEKSLSAWFAVHVSLLWTVCTLSMCTLWKCSCMTGRKYRPNIAHHIADDVHNRPLAASGGQEFRHRKWRHLLYSKSSNIKLQSNTGCVHVVILMRVEGMKGTFRVMTRGQRT